MNPTTIPTPTLRPAGAKLVPLLAVLMLVGGCGRNDASPAPARDTAKSTPEQEFADALKKAK